MNELQNARKVAKRILDAGSRTKETFGSKLPMAQVVVGAYRTMTIEQLEQVRYLLNQIIKEKKIYKNMKENKKKDDSPDIGTAGQR